MLLHRYSFTEDVTMYYVICTIVGYFWKMIYSIGKYRKYPAINSIFVSSVCLQGIRENCCKKLQNIDEISIENRVNFVIYR